MRELIYFVAVSIDGYIAEPNGCVDCFRDEGDHVDDTARSSGGSVPGFAMRAMGMSPEGCFDTVLMGWNTYSIGRPRLEDPYPHLSQWVFSSTDRRGEVHPDVHLTTEDPVSCVRTMKATRGGDIWLCGGGRLASSLAPEIDQVLLEVYPILLGRGVPLFAGRRPPGLQRTGGQAFDSGIAFNRYRVLPTAA